MFSFESDAPNESSTNSQIECRTLNECGGYACIYAAYAHTVEHSIWAP